MRKKAESAHQVSQGNKTGVRHCRAASFRILLISQSGHKFVEASLQIILVNHKQFSGSASANQFFLQRVDDTSDVGNGQQKLARRNCGRPLSQHQFSLVVRCLVFFKVLSCRECPIGDLSKPVGNLKTLKFGFNLRRNESPGDSNSRNEFLFYLCVLDGCAMSSRDSLSHLTPSD